MGSVNRLAHLWFICWLWRMQGLLSCPLSKHLSRLCVPDKIEEILQSGCNKKREKNKERWREWSLRSLTFCLSVVWIVHMARVVINANVCGLVPARPPGHWLPTEGCRGRVTWLAILFQLIHWSMRCTKRWRGSEIIKRLTHKDTQSVYRESKQKNLNWCIFADSHISVVSLSQSAD